MEKNIFVKEALIKYEGYKIKDIELISTVIGEATGKKLYDAGMVNLDDISNYGIKDLIKITGIGKTKAIQLLALYELCKRNIKQEKTIQIQSPNDMYSLCKDMMYEEQEVLRLICLNTKNKILLNKDVFRGGLSSSIVDVRILLREAIRLSSASIVIVHNHPSGDPTPSREDINITTRLNEACKIMGINLLDHIIIGKDKYLSFKEKGMVV